MGSKASTPASSGAEDSPGRQIYSRSERVQDYESSLRQQAQDDSIFMEMGSRTRSSAERIHHYQGGSRSSTDDATGVARIPGVPGRNCGGGVSRSESTSSSTGSSGTGLGGFLSNLNPWRSVQVSDRPRTHSLSHAEQSGARSLPMPTGCSVEEAQESIMSNPRAALTRLLAGRESRSLGAGGGPTSATDGQGSSTSRSSQPRDTFSVRDLTYAAAQEFLAEATLSGLGRVYVTHSLPSHMWAVNGIKCPVCSKFVMPDDIECHLVMCLTKPRLSYNEDVLAEENGECVICLEDLLKGHVIARLPCLCVYHKSCIDQWFEVNRSCPEHPSD